MVVTLRARTGIKRTAPSDDNTIKKKAKASTEAETTSSKASAKKTTAKKAPVKKTTAKKAPANKTTAKKTPVKKETAQGSSAATLGADATALSSSAEANQESTSNKTKRPGRPKAAKNVTAKTHTKLPFDTKGMPMNKFLKMSCLPGMEGRIRRAINQRLFVLGHHKKNANTDVFKVSGSTGNVYDVTIGPKLSCSCVDYRFRRVHCKHLLMVMLKVCHISPESNMYSSLTVKPADLAAIDHLHATNLESRVPEELQTAVDKYLRGEIDEMPSAPRRPLDDGECPVCYESFDPATDEAKTVSCRVCGNNIHTECFRLWESSTGGNATCVFCRAPWNAPTAQAKLAKNHEGFVNVGQLLDLPEKRDYREYLPQTD